MAKSSAYQKDSMLLFLEEAVVEVVDLLFMFSMKTMLLFLIKHGQKYGLLIRVVHK